MTKPTLTIDVVSDVVCPWCYLGKKRLEQAVALVPEVDVTIRWRPYQLDPSVPPEGLDRKEYMAKKFGNLAALDEAHKRLTEYGREVGIRYRFDDITRSANTIDAHRVFAGPLPKARTPRWSSASSPPTSARATTSATGRCWPASPARSASIPRSSQRALPATTTATRSKPRSPTPTASAAHRRPDLHPGERAMAWSAPSRSRPLAGAIRQGRGKGPRRLLRSR